MTRFFATIGTEDQWRRCAFTSASLELGVVQLAAQPEPDAEEPEAGEAQPAAGLAFDAWCRLFHSLPERGQVERLLWKASDGLRPPGTGLPTRDLFEAQPAPVSGDFAPESSAGPLDLPLGIGVDEANRLWIAESRARRVRVFDVLQQSEISSPALPEPPLDIALNGDRAWVLSASAVTAMTWRRVGQETALPAEAVQATRIAVRSDGSLWVLSRGGTAAATVVPVQSPGQAFAVPFATDLEFESASTLVVARTPGATFRRFEFDGENRSELGALTARGYDGRGIVLTPEGRIGFWSALGFRLAVSARRKYVPHGTVVGYRLDNLEFGRRWGRMFVDACVPSGTQLTITALVSDSPPPDQEIPRTPPSNTPVVIVNAPEKSPPMPPASLLPIPEDKEGQKLHRRETGQEIPWTLQADDRFETYEAPVLPGEGRFLWLVLHLTGDTRATPLVRAVRAEYPAHELLHKLPKFFSRDQAAESFLWRYLAPIEGMLGDWDRRGELRHVLLDPRSSPAEMLPWLAGFLGLVLDDRWSERAKRQAIEDAVWLFRFRGTVPGLQRFLQIYLSFSVQIIEQYRLRGHGGGTVGGTAAASTSILGAGFRVGGAIGTEGERWTPDAEPAEDSFRLNAHRFTVFVPGWLSEEQTDVIRHILEVHRPAHTLYDLCSLNAGIRVGRGLYVELTSVVGPSSSWRMWQTGAVPVGREAILGKPADGIPVGGVLDGGARLG
jgi:phage tail-like protein